MAENQTGAVRYQSVDGPNSMRVLPILAGHRLIITARDNRLALASMHFPGDEVNISQIPVVGYFDCGIMQNAQSCMSR